jgi:phosphoribosyl 1,2-cyclic phosphodiesterase
MCVLGSGSGGNSTVIRIGAPQVRKRMPQEGEPVESAANPPAKNAILIDVGFGPSTIVRRLDQAGVQLAEVAAVCVTHLDQDHFRPHWIATLLGWRIAVHLHRWHYDAFMKLNGATEMDAGGLVNVFGQGDSDGGTFSPLPGLRVTGIRLAHDTKGTSGFLVETLTPFKPGRIGYATDLGHVPKNLIDTFIGVDILALESNYDPPMQLRSPRPIFLKRRIMGQAGHLSNEQSFAAVREIVDKSHEHAVRHVVLLHRSRQCNTPQLVHDAFAQDPRLADRVVIADQRRRTRWFTARSPEPATPAEINQLPMFLFD